MHESIFTVADSIPDEMIIGVLLLIGWLAHLTGEKTGIPRVTLLLLAGIVAGPYALDLIPHEVSSWFDQVTHFALAMVGFLLGESFIGSRIKKSGKTVMLISIGEVLMVALLVFLVTQLMGFGVVTGLLLAGIAPASAPAATLDVIHENRAKGPVTDTVLGVVAIDDAWGVILFSLLLVMAQAIGHDTAPLTWVMSGLWEVVGGILLGIALGFPMAMLTGRLREGEPTILEAFGFVVLCGGLALWLNLSYLLACMALGATVANRAKHYTRPFHEIENVSQPFLVIFFLLAGYKLEIDVLPALGVIGILYILTRSIGLIAGANLFARLAKAPETVRKHTGWCLLPQAGVALGLALMAEDRFPGAGETILPLVIASTAIFELAGPVIVRWRLRQAGEI